MDCIYGIINTFVHVFDPAGYKHLTLKLLCIVFTDQRLQFFDQDIRLFFGYEFG